MSQASARYVVSMVENTMQGRSVNENSASMIFFNRMVRYLDLTKLPGPKQRITLGDIRAQCQGIMLERRTPRLVERQESFQHWIVGRFERLAGGKRW